MNILSKNKIYIPKHLKAEKNDLQTVFGDYEVLSTIKKTQTHCLYKAKIFNINLNSDQIFTIKTLNKNKTESKIRNTHFSPIETSALTKNLLRSLDPSDKNLDFKHAEPEILERFLREVDILATSHHKNIQSAIDFGFKDGIPFYVCKYFDGGTLPEHILRKGGVINPSLIFQMLKMLEYIYYDERIMAHRDIKPSNILIDSKGIAVLIDFGCANTSFHVKHRLKTCRIGSSGYISPEQRLNPDNADIRADIYSMGKVFEKIFSMTPNFPNGFLGIINKMIAPNLKNRFQKPSEILLAIRNAKLI